MKSIFFIEYEVRPNSGTKAFEEFGGAFVNCYVQASSEAEATAFAQAEMTESGWSVIAVEETPAQLDRDYLVNNNPDGLRYFDQAVLDGECYVFHTWGIESQEDDVVH